MIKFLITAIFLICSGSYTYASTFNGIDPTRPANLQSESIYRLEQIIYSTSRKGAVINGQVVSIGSLIGDVTVKNISPISVELSGPNGLTTLILVEDVKTNAVPVANEQ